MIASSVEKISEINASVATASEEQSRVTQDISGNVVRVNDLINTNVTSVVHGAESSEKLAGMSEKQKELLSSFRY